MKKFLLFAAVMAACLVSWISVADEVIVKVKDTPASVGVFDLFSQVMAVKLQSKRTLSNGLMVLEGSPEDFANNPAIEWVEINYKQKAYPVIIEPNEGAWGIKKVGAHKAWLKGVTGHNILVAVIDTGVDYNHPALKDCMSDKKGWNFVAKNNDPLDDHSHGTHVSGTICGDKIGVAPDAKILPIKFLDKEGSGETADAIEAVNFAVKEGAQVINASWGGGPFSQGLFDAINEASKKGIWFVAAAGNSYGNNDKKPSYPASYEIERVISVAATDKEDKKADFSCYGEKTVHVAAPGYKIYSSVLDGKFGTYSGTSMASPHVAGIVALILDSEIDKDAKKALIKMSDPVSSLKVVAKGRVNAYRAITEGSEE